MDCKLDFATIDLILNSNLETRGVDAFALSIIKAEKQMRRLFTFLIFQNPAYSSADYRPLRETLAKNRNIYFKGFITGINLILPRPLSDIYGADYDKDLNELLEFTKDRNKIFHGQITLAGLGRDDLIKRINHVRKWCQTLSEKLNEEICYDGFSDSFVKCKIPLALKNMNQFDTIVKYEAFLNNKLR